MEEEAVDEAVALEQREDREPRHVEPQDQQQGVVPAKPRALRERAAMRQGCGKAAQSATGREPPPCRVVVWAFMCGPTLLWNRGCIGSHLLLLKAVPAP